MNQPDPHRPALRHERTLGQIVPAQRFDQGPVRRPVCRQARLRTCGHVSLREVDGEPQLFDAETGATHRLSPAAASLWASLDGRPLQAVRPEVTFEDAAAVEVLELVRRLKALGTIEDLR